MILIIIVILLLTGWSEEHLAWSDSALSGLSISAVWVQGQCQYDLLVQTIQIFLIVSTQREMNMI